MTAFHLTIYGPKGPTGIRQTVGTETRIAGSLDELTLPEPEAGQDWVTVSADAGRVNIHAHYERWAGAWKLRSVAFMGGGPA